jgi:hypothetical protein
MHMAEPAIASGVALAETWTPSRRLQSAAAAERDRIARELARLAARERELAAELAAVQATRADLEEQRHALDRFAAGPDAPPAARPAGGRLRAVAPAHPGAGGAATVLRGARIRETAVRVLTAHAQPGAPVHYRDWFALVAAQGFLPAGKDPVATFLTQIGRSPVVRRTSTPGVYVVDPEVPRHARARLAELAAELSGTEALPAGATVEEIAAARERRARIAAEAQEAERRLDEALRSLAAPAPAGAGAPPA